MMQAATPSANKLEPIKLLLLKSFRRKVSEHNSTATNNTTASGFAIARVFAFAYPETPPPQPKPKTDILLIFWFSLILLMMSASKLGVESPVVETKIRSVISSLFICAEEMHLSLIHISEP